MECDKKDEEITVSMHNGTSSSKFKIRHGQTISLSFEVTSVIRALVFLESVHRVFDGSNGLALSSISIDADKFNKEAIIKDMEEILSKLKGE